MSFFIERRIEKEIDKINDHLPKKRYSISELSEMKKPGFVTRGGEFSAIKKEELEIISNECPEKYYSEVLLPIIILRRVDQGPGIYSIAGGKVELFLIGRMIGYVDLEWSQLSEWKTIDRIARPQVQKIRSILKSTTAIGFTSLNE
ncbi:MAG: hypothetical protein BAJATHORv1_20595 [Candidatus Thorarchaeota archaeon]|nr:MAG: hypothetical protein BAJATHORv1_20595 [Candidatus Thorarchaeota archaeon]